MDVRLGIDTCFAVKRWPRVEDWVPLVRDRLGLRLVQHSFDLVPTGARRLAARALAGSDQAAGLELHSTFTGLAAYSDNLLLDPDAGSPSRRRRLVSLGDRVDRGRRGTRLAATSGPSASRTGPTRASRARCGRAPADRSRAGRPGRAAGLELPAGREPGRGPGAVDDGDDPGSDDRRRRRPGAGPAVPRCRPHVRPGHDRRRSRSVCLAARARSGRPGHPAPAVGSRGRPPLAVHGEPQRRGRIDADRVLAALARAASRRRPHPRGDPRLRAGRCGGPRRPGRIGRLLARGARPGRSRRRWPGRPSSTA